MDFASRDLVRQRAGRRCEYCRIHEDDEPYAFHLEHVIPKSTAAEMILRTWHGAATVAILAKGANLSGRVQTEVVPLFHPRRQQWNRHFRWIGPILVGKTKCGQATVQVLNINQDDRVRLRDILIASRAFPPK